MSDWDQTQKGGTERKRVTDIQKNSNSGCRTYNPIKIQFKFMNKYVWLPAMLGVCSTVYVSWKVQYILFPPLSKLIENGKKLFPYKWRTVVFNLQHKRFFQLAIHSSFSLQWFYGNCLTFASFQNEAGSFLNQELKLGNVFTLPYILTYKSLIYRRIHITCIPQKHSRHGALIPNAGALNCRHTPLNYHGW